jgi:hypothetical protein
MTGSERPGLRRLASFSAMATKIAPAPSVRSVGRSSTRFVPPRSALKIRRITISGRRMAMAPL